MNFNDFFHSKSRMFCNVFNYYWRNRFINTYVFIVKYIKKGYKVMYFPITFRPRQGGKNSINMKKIFKIGAKAFMDFAELGKTFSKYGKGKKG